MTGDQLRMTQGDFGGDSSIIDIKMVFYCPVHKKLYSNYLPFSCHQNKPRTVPFLLPFPFGYNTLHHQGFTVSRAQSQALPFLISFIFGKPLPSGFHYDNSFINDGTEPREGKSPEMAQLINGTTRAQNQVMFMLKSMFLN